MQPGSSESKAPTRARAIKSYGALVITVLITVIGAAMMTITSSPAMKGAAFLWLPAALQLIGGETVNGKLRDDKGRMAQLAKSGKRPQEITRDLYMVALSREPTATELAAAVKHLTSSKDLRQAVEDLGWVIINSKEFLFRH